ncbi:DUF5617 domain-containing protein [Legionella brunensis]|uniref:DUF5617 domain-containing protein n=1 Tax=Legionella brunensis TaxID=29422 RepID=UPI001040E51F|nr:DUF5617 domain-containing protein [Legionella brunensis]
MPFFTQIDTRKFAEKIKEKATYIIDSQLFEIPETPLLASYEDPYAEVRLISEDTINGLKKVLDDIRKLITRDEADVSAISIALEEENELPELQKKYKSILLTMGNQPIETIFRKCAQFQSIIMIGLLQPVILNEVVLRLNDDFLPFLEDILSIIEIMKGLGPNDPILFLPQFCQAMVLKQAAIVDQKKKTLLHEGEVLTENQVVCPFTRKKIAIDASSKSEKRAKDLVAIYIALSKLADLDEIDDNNSMSNFLASQPKNYLQEANRTLIQYLVSPQQFDFTFKESQFLADIGTVEAAKQVKSLYERYTHLWHEEKSFDENALDILIDYNKQNWFSPTLGLFFTGHWNRNHHQIVSASIKSLQKEEANISFVLEQLEMEMKKNPNFNAQGSLMRRLEFIRYQGQFKEVVPEELQNPKSYLNLDI